VANPSSIITIIHDEDQAAATLAAQLARISTESRSGCRVLGDFFHALASGTRQGKVAFLQDADGAFGTIQLTCVAASLAANDWVYIGPVGLRCVTGAVTALQDTFTKDTGNSETATSLAAAVNNNTFLSQYVSAAAASNVVTITCKLPGPICHLIAVRKEVATAAGLVIDGEASRTLGCLTTTGGTKPTATVTCVFANTDDADTVTIAGKVLTGDTTTPADADEFEVATSDTNQANTLTTAVNAAEEIRGHVWADNVAGVVTLTAYVPGTGINAMTIASSDADGLVVSGSTMTDGATSATSAQRTYARGVA